MLIGIFLCQNFAYSADTFCLRVPVGQKELYKQIEDILLSQENAKELNLSHQVRNAAENMLGFEKVELRRNSYFDLRDERSLMLTGLVQRHNGQWLLRYALSADDPYYGEVLLVDGEGKEFMRFKVSSEHGVLDPNGFAYSQAVPFAELPVYKELSQENAKELNLLKYDKSIRQGL